MKVVIKAKESQISVGKQAAGGLNALSTRAAEHVEKPQPQHFRIPVLC